MRNQVRNHFSLFNLFIATAYACVAVSGYAQPTSIWGYVNFWLWIGVLCYWGTIAANGSVFARGALAWTFAYVCASYAENYKPFRGLTALLSHSLMLDRITESSFRSFYGNADAENALNRIAITNVAFLFGVLGGALSVGLARRRQRPGDLQKA